VNTGFSDSVTEASRAHRRYHRRESHPASDYLELLMRELIYLSDRKLQQFLPDPIPKWRRLGRLKAEVNAPIGSISVESSADCDQSAQAAQLQRVVRQVEQTAQWFTADGIRAGDWIFFEERINYWVIKLSRGSAIVLFLNLDHAETLRTRLLLHGSPEHLLTGAQAQDELRLGSPGPSPSDGSRFRDMLPVLRKVMGSIDGASKKRESQEARNLGWDLEDVVLALDKSNSAATAMWLAGYGRVTARMESSPRGDIKATLVAASPLYVELLMPPDSEDESLLSPRPNNVANIPAERTYLGKSYSHRSRPSTFASGQPVRRY
jgi:hypothetical protein